MFNLINMNGRVYDSEIARFVSPDPIIQDPYNILSYNRYTYCLNNPLKYTDPSGYDARRLWEIEMIDREAYGEGAQFSNNYVNYWGQVQDAYENMHTYEDSENAKKNTNEYGLPGEGQNGKGDGGIYYDWVSNSYRFVDNPEIGLDPSLFTDIQSDPTIDKGGFINNAKFYDYMLNHAKNTPVEVGAFELRKNSQMYFFILPWKDNDISHTRFSLSLSDYGLDGYNLIQVYHTHPGSTDLSTVDKLWSQGHLMPIWVINPNGNSYGYMPYLDRPGGEGYKVDLKYFLNK
jgi:proteasome lid subunit RPN8/RPN11